MELGPETRLPESWSHLLFTLPCYPVLVHDHSTPTTFHREIHQSQVQSTRKKYTEKSRKLFWWKHSWLRVLPGLPRRGRKLRVINFGKNLKNFKTKRNKNASMFQLHLLGNKKTEGSTWVGLKHMFAPSVCLP